LGYTGRASLQCTMDVLGKALLVQPKVRWVDRLAERVVGLLAIVAAGYSEAAYLVAVEQHEGLDRAMLKTAQDAQRNVTASHARFDAVFNHSNDGMAISDLKGCWRVGRALATGALPIRELRHSLGREPLVSGVPYGMVGQLVRFGIVGVASTLAYALLYLALHAALGAQAANLTALLLTAIGNTAANRAFTFAIRGRAGVARHQLHGLLVFMFGLAITSGSLYLLHRFDPTVGKGVELSVLVLANLVATVVRFVALRRVFGMHTRFRRRVPPPRVDSALKG
jgi:putative flippase GtrA